MISKTSFKSLDIDEIAENCARFLNNKKAFKTNFVDMRETNNYINCFLITTANSFIHCKAIAKDLRKYLLSSGLKERSKSDLDSGWIILDFDEIIVHIFTEQLREYYQLEKLWADARITEYSN